MVVAVMLTIMLFTPLATMTTPIPGQDAMFDVWGIHLAHSQDVPLIYFGVLVGLAAALSLAIVMLYKKRKVQLQLCYALEILLIGVLVFEIFYGYQIYTIEDYTTDFSPLLLLPVLAIPLTWLASRAIIKDIALVSSYDRMR